jgi:hypothetical protein
VTKELGIEFLTYMLDYQCYAYLVMPYFLSAIIILVDYNLEEENFIKNKIQWQILLV